MSPHFGGGAKPILKAVAASWVAKGALKGVAAVLSIGEALVKGV